MIAPISVCMITRNDPHLESTILSIKDYVKEICVVITSDNDSLSETICKKYNITYKTFTDCNDDQDRINNFSLARNESIKMSSEPWIMWLDSDDIIINPENLYKYTQTVIPQGFDTIQILFPYEYGYDNSGNITCRQYRERLMKGKDNFLFIQPVHEVITPKTNVKCLSIQADDVLFKHKRQYIAKPTDPKRNLRILENYFANGGNDIRNKYYIALEYFNHNDLENSEKYLNEYINVSGWEDECAMANMKLVDICQIQGRWKDGLNHAFNLLQMKHNWFESYYCLARMYAGLNQWNKVIHYGLLALKQPPTNTLLFVNHSDRFMIYNYLHVAYANIGNFQSAYDNAEKGLEGLPDHPGLLDAKRHYQRQLGIKSSVDTLNAKPGKLSIVFITAPWGAAWSPDTVKETGIGGSEMMLIHNARNLAALGHTVRVYCSADGYFDDVYYLHENKFGDLSCDVLVVSRYANYLDDKYNVNAKIKLLWLHDVVAHNATNELLLKADKIICLSEWHKQNVIKAHNVANNHIIVSRNGIDLNRFKAKVKKHPYRCINSSSPDRSWPVLLEMWKQIKTKCPKAELHLYYGFDNWRVAAQHDPLQTELINKLEHDVKTTPGVFYHGKVSQDELAKAFLQSKAWLFPTWWTETSCISAMEARVANCHIVATDLAALTETCSNYDKAHIIEGNWTDKSYQEKFIAETIKVLNGK